MDYSGPDDDLDVAWCSAFRPVGDVIDLVGQTAVPRGVFTNNGPLEEEVLTRLYPEVFALFDHLFFAIGCQQTNRPAVYHQISTKLAVAPPQIRFVDDGEGRRWECGLGGRPVRRIEPISGRYSRSDRVLPSDAPELTIDPPIGIIARCGCRSSYRFGRNWLSASR
jgi:hypothetical protein